MPLPHPPLPAPLLGSLAERLDVDAVSNDGKQTVRHACSGELVSERMRTAMTRAARRSRRRSIRR